MKLEFSRQIFEKYSGIKFHGTPSIGNAELFHVDGRTDTHDEANSRLSQFCTAGLITVTVNNALEATKITTTVLLEILFMKLTIYIVQSVRTYM